MGATDFKYLIVHRKKDLKFLCFSHEQVQKIRTLLKEVSKTEILFLNTNLGLEVFYLSPTNLNDLIISTLNIVSATQESKIDLCLIDQYTHRDHIKLRFGNNIELLNAYPFAFRCYIQSAFRQFGDYDASNREIIHELIDLWHHCLVTANIYEHNRKLLLNYLRGFISRNETMGEKIDLVNHLALLTLSLSSTN